MRGNFPRISPAAYSVAAAAAVIIAAAAVSAAAETAVAAEDNDKYKDDPEPGVAAKAVIAHIVLHSAAAQRL